MRPARNAQSGDQQQSEALSWVSALEPPAVLNRSRSCNFALEAKLKARQQKHSEPSPTSRFFGELANRTSIAAGRASTFLLAVGIVIASAITGPIFNFSDTWQLVINTGTTIVTFLMVFLIQNSQNRDSAAIQVKLDELIRVGAARNSLVGIEHLSDEELEDIRSKCEARAAAEEAGDRTVEEAGQAARQAAERITS